MSDYRFWTEEEDNKIRFKRRDDESWETFTKRELPHRTTTSVRKHALKYLKINNNSYRKRFYYHNHNIWDKLTPESCYWAGFLAADGCLMKKGKTNFALAIELSSIDRLHLESFKKFTSYTGPIRTNKKKSSHSGKPYEYNALSINCHEEWTEPLLKYFNITPQKTKTLKPPNINSQYLRSCFLLGFLDGDACIRVNNYGNMSIALTCASIEMMEWIKSELNFLVDNKEVRKVRERNIALDRKGNYTFSVNGNAATVVANKLKRMPVPMLKRKWCKESVINNINEQKEKYPELFN